jgi:protein phosphatase 1 regulatory subunit 3A/B/C/D/E
MSLTVLSNSNQNTSNNAANNGSLMMMMNNLSPDELESRLEQINLNLIKKSLYSNKSMRSIFNRSRGLYSYSNTTQFSLSNSSISPTEPDTSSSNNKTCIESSNQPSATLIKNSSNNSLKDSAGIKKVVRFADALGLELVTVKIVSTSTSSQCLNYLNNNNSSDDDENEDLNKIPLDYNTYLDSCTLDSIHYSDHYSVNRSQSDKKITHINFRSSNSSESSSGSDSSDNEDLSELGKKIRARMPDPNQFVYNNLVFTWRCGFEQPSLAPDFYSKLNEKKVCLESITTDHFILNGFVRVLNLSVFKRIFIRYTLNNWLTHNDYDCNYLMNSTQSKLNDRFKFSIILDKKQFFETIDNCRTNIIEPCIKLEFAICYELKQSDELDEPFLNAFWDNNNSKNYYYDCFFRII